MGRGKRVDREEGGVVRRNREGRTEREREREREIER